MASICASQSLGDAGPKITSCPPVSHGIELTGSPGTRLECRKDACSTAREIWGHSANITAYGSLFTFNARSAEGEGGRDGGGYDVGVEKGVGT